MFDDFEPIAKVGHNLAIQAQGKVHFWEAIFREGMPPGSASVIDFGAITAGASSTKAAQDVLKLDDGYLLQLRMKVIDDVEVALHQLGGTGRFWAKNWQAKVTRFTPHYDRSLRSTEFFIEGFNHDAQFVVTNPLASNQARARVMFWGYKFVLRKLDAEPQHCTWLPADGQIAA